MEFIVVVCIVLICIVTIKGAKRQSTEFTRVESQVSLRERVNRDLEQGKTELAISRLYGSLQHKYIDVELVWKLSAVLIERGRFSSAGKLIYLKMEKSEDEERAAWMLEKSFGFDPTLILRAVLRGSCQRLTRLDDRQLQLLSDMLYLCEQKESKLPRFLYPLEAVLHKRFSGKPKRGVFNAAFGLLNPMKASLKENQMMSLFKYTVNHKMDRKIGINALGFWCVSASDGMVRTVNCRSKCMFIISCLEMNRSEFYALLSTGVTNCGLAPAVTETFPVKEVLKLALVSGTYWATRAADWLIKADLDEELSAIIFTLSRERDPAN